MCLNFYDGYSTGGAFDSPTQRINVDMPVALATRACFSHLQLVSSGVCQLADQSQSTLVATEVDLLS